MNMVKISEDDRRKILLAAEQARNIFCTGLDGSAGACIECVRRISYSPVASLEKYNIKHNMIFGEFSCETKKKSKSHAWIEFPQYDNTILDVTADQFGNFPKIWFPADKKCYQKGEIIK
jgi:hypothetical protein